MDSNDSVFWISIATLLTGFTLKLSSLIFKSKCDTCSICGLIKVHRNVEIEDKEFEFSKKNAEKKTVEDV